MRTVILQCLKLTGSLNDGLDLDAFRHTGHVKQFWKSDCWKSKSHNYFNLANSARWTHIHDVDI